MSREYANKLNQMLMIRAKNRVEDFHKPTGITKLLERNQTKNTREDFNKTFKEHIEDGIKTRNIRGLFRVPEINDTNHLICRCYKEEDERTIWIYLIMMFQSVPHNRVMMSYPLRRPDQLDLISREESEILLVLRSGETREAIKVNPATINRPQKELWPIPGFEASNI